MEYQISVINKDPALIDGNNYISLGAMRSRGDTFVVLFDLNTGKTHIEEFYTTQALGHFIASHNEVKDDGLWNALTYTAINTGMLKLDHIADCAEKLGIQVKKEVLAAMRAAAKKSR